MYKHGIFPGRFLPCLEEHLRLIGEARSRCERLTIWVCSLPDDPVPGWERYASIRNGFPDLDVRHLPVREAAEWPARISRLSPVATDICFLTSEFPIAGLPWPQEIYPVDTELSAGILRHPLAFWDRIPEEIRPHFVRRIALLGPESCGKSYLAEALARHFQTVSVEEYGRTYCEKFGMDLTPLDFAHIAGGQLHREDEMARKARKYLFCDTELLITQIWSEVYFEGRCQPWIIWANHLRHYHFFLLLAPDIPWKNDGLRRYEEQRNRMFERLKLELESRDLPYAIVSGGFEHRTQIAVDAVDAYFREQQ